MPLSGVKVVEVGLNLAGPLAGAILADLGADVIKVERPETGDDARAWGPPFVDDTALPFHNMNRNKRSVVVNFKDAEEMQRLYQLIEQSDIFLHNLRPGVAEQVGLGADRLLSRNPKLIYCAVTAFGHTGPLKDKPGYEILLQAFGGLMSMTGQEDGPPVRMGTSVVDYGTGMWTAIATLAALRKRDATGRGCVITASLFETAVFYVSTALIQYKKTGKAPSRHATGSPRQVAFGAFETQNGPLVLGVANSRLFLKLAKALGRDEWATDPRYQTNAGRMEHREYLMQEIAAHMAQEPKETWLERLEAIGVPCAPILTIPEVLAQPQTKAMDIIRQVPGSALEVMNLPFSIDGQRPDFRSRAPKLGEHTDEVFKSKYTGK